VSQFYNIERRGNMGHLTVHGTGRSYRQLDKKQSVPFLNGSVSIQTHFLPKLNVSRAL
jgi:hypothetical protein